VGVEVVTITEVEEEVDRTIIITMMDGDIILTKTVDEEEVVVIVAVDAVAEIGSLIIDLKIKKQLV
jgi:hypothetical protein